MTEALRSDMPGATAAHANSCRVEILRSHRDIETLAGEWDGLFQRAAAAHQVFQNRRLLDIWMRLYADPRDEPIVVAGYRGGRLAVLLPLVRQRRFGFTILRFMGLPVAQYGDCLAEPDIGPQLAADVWAAVEGLDADFLEARRLRADAAFLRLAPESTDFERQEAPFALLASRVAGEDPGDAYSAKYRSNFRRRRRRLDERGEVSHLADIGGDRQLRLVARAIDMKRHWLRRHDLQSPAIHDERFGAFFMQAAADPASGLQVSAICIDGRPVAIDLSFACKGTCFGHVLAVEPEREDQGVGTMMVHQAFAAAKARGNAVFDLLAPSNPHKMSHADGVVGVTSRAYPFTPAGRIACGLLARNALPAAKGLAARLPAPLVEWLGRRI